MAIDNTIPKVRGLKGPEYAAHGAFLEFGAKADPEICRNNFGA
ncbi:MAG TPA: hypothetical protein VIN05_11510 [Roseovarius sp.]